jgi:hypothetical protein
VRNHTVITALPGHARQGAVKRLIVILMLELLVLLFVAVAARGGAW